MSRRVASAKQLAMMTKVLDVYCREYGIEDVAVREALGQQLLRLFDQGRRTENELAVALKDELGRVACLPVILPAAKSRLWDASSLAV